MTWCPHILSEILLQPMNPNFPPIMYFRAIYKPFIGGVTFPSSSIANLHGSFLHVFQCHFAEFLCSFDFITPP